MLLPHHEALKDFVKDIASNLFNYINLNYEIKEDVTKLRLIIESYRSHRYYQIKVVLIRVILPLIPAILSGLT